MRLRNVLLTLLVLSGVTLYLLTVATGNTSKLTEYFWVILILNGAIILSLFSVLAIQFYRLYQDVRHGVYGAKLTTSMLKKFTLVAILPGLFLFAVSTQFIAHSINSWFGNDTRDALDRSLNLSKAALNNFLTRVIADAHIVGLKTGYGLSLRQLPADIFTGLGADLSKFDQVALLTKDDGRILAASNNPRGLAWPVPADLDWVKISNNPLVAENNLLDNKLYAQVYLHVYPNQGGEYILFFRKKVADNIASDVLLIENASAKYAELTYNKEGLQTFFILTLLVATLVSVLMALLAAIFFSRRFVEPLVTLSQLTRAVSRGDYSGRNPVFRDDELGQLSVHFNNMTAQLQLEREKTQFLYHEQQSARKYFESILLNLTSGVITLDAGGYVKTYNNSVEDILKFSLQPYLDCPWQQWPENEAHIRLLKKFMQDLVGRGNGKSLEFEYSANDAIQVLLGRATVPDEHDDGGLVMVFDDVTKLVTAQKEAAWGEVARRLAHEIKNPLTPIQLSAERVQFKLESKLDAADALILKKSTTTIINQVTSLKEMVEDFRNYARSVVLKAEKIDFNDLVREVLLLYEGMQPVIAVDLTVQPLPVSVDATAMRQVLHNILKNAIEAAGGSLNPAVTVSTVQEGNLAVFTVINNGKAFSQDMIGRAFDPYVTDKAGGTGLGLAIVKKIIEEHEGVVILQNRLESGGAVVKITLNLVGA